MKKYTYNPETEVYDVTEFYDHGRVSLTRMTFYFLGITGFVYMMLDMTYGCPF